MKNLFLQGPEVTNLVLKAKRIKESDKVFSDIVDEAGNYYVDLVQQGGGVLGIALFGYTYILEQAGIRFYNLAGTSVGAINTLMMAGFQEIGQPVSVEILDRLSQKNIFDFVDGPPRIKKMVQKKIEGRNKFLWHLIKNFRKIYRLLKNDYGLNPGENLENWLAEELRRKQILTYGDLAEFRKNIPQLRHRLRKELTVKPAKIAIITSDITTHTRVELPRMAELYWKDVKAVSPASFVHASMALPYFFYPVTKKNIPNAGTLAGENWQELAGFYGEIPTEVKFVDGGILSNFPINVFHVEGIPAKPTFGARLSAFRERYAYTDTFFKYSGAILDTMQQIYDYEVILRHPDYRRLICHIDADQKFNWLNFGMPKARQKQLFVLGAKKALLFLEKFDWEEYKATRRKLLDME